MPNRPAGESALALLEADWRALELELAAFIDRAVFGDRRALYRTAAELLARINDPERAMVALERAYRSAAVDAGGSRRRVKDGARGLGRALAMRLDRAAAVTTRHMRLAIGTVTENTLEEATRAGPTAYIDGRGTRWPAGAYATMQGMTLGRTASTLGLTDHAPAGAVVVIDAGGCSYCNQFDGEQEIGAGPLPPFHPSCSCVASIP